MWLAAVGRPGFFNGTAAIADDGLALRRTRDDARADFGRVAASRSNYVLGIGYPDLVASCRALAQNWRKISHRHGLGDGTGYEVEVLASRLSKGRHDASAPQPQCSPCLFRSPWSETGRDKNDPLDASRRQALAPRRQA
jgi:hypothetical protein